MKETIYRLGEYKIIESDTGQLMWEAHFGFGESEKGRCFRKGSVLFIGSAENCRNGFLKGEFLDDLKKYPKWGKTKFYCIGVCVHHCKNGKSVCLAVMVFLGFTVKLRLAPKRIQRFVYRLHTGLAAISVMIVLLMAGHMIVD